ncbi:MAG: hypothetical protein IJW49_11210 [Clostridia bacterium]|nr:hypothetical protein [Clostridia bacterium]
MKRKKLLTIIGITVAALLLGAVLVGVLNALVAGGSWNFGWTDYRYDESGYQIGDGSVNATELSEIDVDWIDGEVRIVLCQDACVSLSESSEKSLSEDSLLRYRISEDGKRLSVKYRKSSWYFGNSKNKEKTLILRIPEHMIESGQLKKLKIKGISANVTVDGTPFMENGSVRFAPEQISVETKTGNIKLILPRDASFALKFDSKKDLKPTVDFSYQRQNGQYICGEGSMKINITSKSGKLLVTH